jgi:hypothetical protein
MSIDKEYRTMTDPTSLAVQPTDLSAVSTARTPQSGGFDPAETRLFANMLQGVQPPPSVGGGPSVLGDAAMAYAQQLNGNVRSYEEMRRSLIESVDLSDPIKSMFALTDHSMQAHTMFARLHISTGLASAATSLFGTLLKNQQ